MAFPDGLIDLRSDTVTRPTPEMYAAMAKAPLGDDTFDDDPTVHQLQELAAQMTGHEAGLLVSSGTMGNLVALLTHGGRSTEVIVGDKSHIYVNEVGGMSGLAGQQPAVIPNQPDGTLKLEDIAGAIRDEDVHYPRTVLVCLENTQNMCGGVVLSGTYTRQVSELAHGRGIRLHLDGARLFNAAVAQGVAASELAGPADSVTFCLSKGLSAPVGSVLCGSQAFIAEARRFRKMVGGGMRQAGVLAAAGVVALEQMVERLEDDHTHARQLAADLAGVPGLVVDAAATNMVYFSLAEPVRATMEQIERQMREKGILVCPSGRRQFRFVTHYWVTAADCKTAVRELREVLTNA